MKDPSPISRPLPDLRRTDSSARCENSFLAAAVFIRRPKSIRRGQRERKGGKKTGETVRLGEESLGEMVFAQLFGSNRGIDLKNGPLKTCAHKKKRNTDSLALSPVSLFFLLRH